MIDSLGRLRPVQPFEPLGLMVIVKEEGLFVEPEAWVLWFASNLDLEVLETKPCDSGGLIVVFRMDSKKAEEIRPRIKEFFVPGATAIRLIYDKSTRAGVRR